MPFFFYVDASKTSIMLKTCQLPWDFDLLVSLTYGKLKRSPGPSPNFVLPNTKSWIRPWNCIGIDKEGGPKLFDAKIPWYRNLSMFAEWDEYDPPSRLAGSATQSSDPLTEPEWETRIKIGFGILIITWIFPGANCRRTSN